MALIFPLGLLVFADTIRATFGTTFRLNEPVEMSGSAEGEIFGASNADPMWEGTIVTTATTGPLAARTSSLMNALRAPNRSFMVRDLAYIGPQSDPTGAILANRTLTLAAVGTDRIKIAGFPPEIVLLPGDKVSWSYGANPVRYALHEVTAASDSYGYDSGGVSGWIDLAPIIRAGVSVGDSVRLVKPVCKALPFTASISGGESRAGGGNEGWSLDWRQTLR